TDACEWDYGSCTPLASCNNGMLDSGELCDGSSIDPDLTCEDYGHTQGSLACGNGCAIDTSNCHTCGDGEREATETCDDFDMVGGDGCSELCSVEPGWLCSYDSPSICAPVCGDGKIVGGEECDDGDADSQDGCSAICKIEVNCTCSGTPSACSCATVETITTLPQHQYIDAGEIVLDAGTPRAAYMFGVDFTAPMTGYAREHAYLMYGERGTSSWVTSEVQTWDQTRTAFGEEDVELAIDGGTLRAYYHRIYHPGGPFAVATRGASWTFAYDDPYY